MKNDFILINQSALEALCKNETYQAQTIFQQNAKNNPCFVTFNNLGYFYISNGLFKPNYNVRSARKLGINYLKKAEKYQLSNLTSSALGGVFFDYKNYEEAIKYFKQACEIRSDYASMYNLAISFFAQNMYKESLPWLKKALTFCESYDLTNTLVSDDYTNILVSYFYTLIQIDKKKCREELNRLLEYNMAYTERDKFIVSFLCNDLQAAEKQIKPMFEYFHVGINEIAMVFDCFFILNKREKAEEYLNYGIKCLEGFNYNVQFEIELFKRAFLNEEFRKEKILTFQCIRPLIPQCCYCGCEQHNPL